MNMASAVAKILDDLRARGGLEGTDVANITAVSPATVSRWTLDNWQGISTP
jgi:predicted transcriptional regulator